MPLIPTQKTRAKKAFAKPPVDGQQMQRSYREVVAVGAQNSDWQINSLGEDADVFLNQYLLRQRMRDLWRTTEYFQKYREELAANVQGHTGIMLRMKVTENEARVVYAPDEKAHLAALENRRLRIFDHLCKNDKSGNYARSVYEVFQDRAKATVKIGEPDFYANTVIEEGWKEWKRREYCDVRRARNYNTLCNLRLSSAGRDGGMFIRMIRDPKANAFGFTLQLVNDEWCDFWFNAPLANGNVVRMGIEYQWHTWGLGEPVGYYFIKRQPMDWQYSQPGQLFNGGVNMYDRIKADDIIHYARYTDVDSTRPAPWGACNIPNTRQLFKYQEAEVIAARVAACKMGWLYSDLVPEGGFSQGAFAIDSLPNPKKSRVMNAEPGSFQALDWGVKFQGFDPTHPNGNFDTFRKAMLRAWCAGLPGANYNIIANDLEGVNYSSGRLGMLDERELWKLLQSFDIDTAERPIFENWLEMALLTRAIPLPESKYKKFNKPHFRGRRWAWTDPLKDGKASALAIENGLSTRTREIENSDCEEDFEEVTFKRAEEHAFLVSMGLPTATTESKQAVDKQEEADDPATEDEDETPAPKKKARTNGHRLNIGA